MAQLLDSVEYYLVLEEGGIQQQAAQQSEPGTSGGEAADASPLQAAVAGALAAPEFLVERKAKKGGGWRGTRGNKKKPSAPADLRWALQELQAVPASRALAAGVPAEVLAPAGPGPDGTPPPRKHVLRLRTACANGNPVLTPAMAVDMINRAAPALAAPGSSGKEEDGGGAAAGAYALAHIHRAEIRLRPMPVPQPDHLKLRSLCRCAQTGCMK